MSAAIFSGLSIKLLKDILKFKTGTLIVTGQSADPTSVAFDAPQNSIYIQSGTTNIYKKLDAGLSTNWQLIGSTVGAASSTDNAIARFDGTTGKVIQNSAVTVDDSGNISTSGTVDGRDVSTDGSTLDSHLNGGSSKHDANEVDYERADGSKKNIQAASDDVEAALTDLDDAVGALAPTPTNYTPVNAAVVASHLAAVDAKLGDVISTINMLEFQDSVLSATVLTPPGSPSTGDRYLINGVGLSGWTGQDNKIAEWNGASWTYTNPTTGMFVASDAEPTRLYLYGGASWSDKSFELTTASGFLSKSGFDVQLTNLTSQNIIVGSAGNVATSVDTSSVGDISASTTGGLEIKAGAIVDADISGSAAITRSKLAAGTASHVVIHDGSGNLSSEATLAKSRGGSGQDNSSLTFPASGTLATLAGAEQLTNKDIDGGTASNSLRITLPKAGTSTLDGLTRKEGTVVYDTDTKQPMFDNGTVLKPFDSNALNTSFFSDYACLDISKVSTYDDSASVPIDGTGGTATGLSTALETTTQITGTKSYKLSKDSSNRQGKGFALLTDKTLDNTVKNGEPVLVQFRYKTSANYATDEVKLYVYRVGSNILEPLTGTNNQGGVNTNSLYADQTGLGQFSAYVNCNSSDTAIRVIAHIAGTSALAYDLTVDNVFIGTTSQVIADKNFAASMYLSANQTGVNPNNTYVKINVDTISLDDLGLTSTVNNRITFSQACRASVKGTIALSGTNILANYYAAVIYKNGSFFAWGNAQFSGAGMSLTIDIDITDDFTAGDYVELYLYGQGNNSASTLTVSGATGITRLEVTGYIPGNVISSTQAMFQNIKAKYARTSVQTIPTATGTIVDFDVKRYDPFNTVTTGIGTWKFVAPEKGVYKFSAHLQLASGGGWASGEYAASWYSINDSTSTEQIDMYQTSTHSNAVSLTNTNTIELNKGDFVRCLIYQNSGGSLSLDSGRNWINIEKVPDLSVVGLSGGIAPEEISSNSAGLGTYSLTVNQIGDLTSIVLTPGVWDINAMIVYYNTNTTTTSRIRAGISTTSGNSETGMTYGINYAAMKPTVNSSDFNTLTIPSWRQTVTSTTTYYLKSIAETSITNLQRAYGISAKRVK